jgi:hypothetical protein
MDDTNPFSLNVRGVTDLVESKTNKIPSGAGQSPEGVAGEKYDVLDLHMTDEELLKLRDEYEKSYAPYEGKLKPRVAKMRESYQGKRPQGQYLVDTELPLAANLQFEAVETFLAAALSKNPSPVVWADNTNEGNQIADNVKIMLQFHADQLAIRRKLSVMVRQWSMDLLGGLKPGWNEKLKDVMIDNVKIRDYVFDPDGYVDAYGDFSSWYGERKEVTAEKLIELFPKHETYISRMVDAKLGTKVIYTEWWANDDFCFYTFKERVLDKHKNHLFKYPEPMLDAMGQPAADPISGKPMMTTPRNHFAHPKKPGIFLSVYSLQEQPHDITSNIEQNIPNQNLITRRTEQIDFNVSAANNSYAFSEDNFNQETGKQAANARRKGNPILVPSGGPIANAILPLNAQSLPADVFNQLEISKNDLKSSWGIQGIASQKTDEDQTARGMILNQSHDTSRISGGIGASVEQVADNVFNWLVQLYYVFYDEQHFAAIMGNAKAVEYVTLSSSDLIRQLIVSVAPDSMKPKDEVTNLNLAQALFDKGAIGPKTLLKIPDPDEAAADGVLYKLDPMSYFKMNFPEYAAELQQHQQQDAMVQAQNAGVSAQASAAGTAAGTPPEATTEPKPPMSQEPASAALSNVPLPQ